MNEFNRYNKLNEYLKEKYGERTLKICIDGGFTCPNRDSKVSTGGCIFCTERGSGEHLKSTNIKEQIESHLNSYRGMRANKFIAYFQNYTNTYDSVENLRAKYDSALIDDRIVCLAVATRPDCISEEITSLLSEYKRTHDVWVELGFQTADDEIAKNINRGYDSVCLKNALDILNKYNIETIVHIMVGLPGENEDTIKNTVEYLNTLNYQGIKIHSTYITKNTKLASLYNDGLYSPITLDYYIEKACYILTHINPTIIIHKISGDAPKDLLLAPQWNLHKKWIMNGIDKYMRENNLYQGMYYKS